MSTISNILGLFVSFFVILEFMAAMVITADNPRGPAAICHNKCPGYCT